MLRKLLKLTKGAAWRIVGGLSRTSKMPCHSWGIPATACRAGSHLAKIQGTTCNGCCALKGAYRWSTVSRAYQRRLDLADDPDWVVAMVKLVYWQAEINGDRTFRWFDSGDLQDVEMLERIVRVARHTPEIRHWVPTREHGIVRRFLATEELPANLTVRLSAIWVDASPPTRLGLPTSTVHRDGEPIGFECPAYGDEPATCGSCRACWDPEVPNVSYPFH